MLFWYEKKVRQWERDLYVYKAKSSLPLAILEI